ncbi:unnamed protein product [Musa acuminata var. zebrina]
MPLADVDDGFFLFPVEEIAQYPLPGYVAPSSISFSLDGRLSSYYFSPDGTLHRKVFAFDVASRWEELVFSPPDGGGLDESNLSAEEKLRRERALGVTRYEWRARSPSLLASPLGSPSSWCPCPLGSVLCSISRFGCLLFGSTEVYFQEVCGSEPELKLPSCPGSPITDPHLSSDGSMLADVKDDELHVLSLSQGKPKQLTIGARTRGKTHGLAEYIVQEDMDRKTGFWWSPEGKYLAFAEVDSAEIPLFRIMHTRKSLVGSNAQEDHAYPSAGAANVKIRLGVVLVVGGEVTWMGLIVEQTMKSVGMQSI